MSSDLPIVSVIIPSRPSPAPPAALHAVARLDYPRHRLEILVARGSQPAAQRNAALRTARGELVYFLDDDAQPRPDNLRRALAHFERPAVQIVGGPNLCPPGAPPLEQLFAVVLGSWLAFGPSRARYTPVGRARPTSEKELILCNLAARRAALLERGGFDESLYPNEENALMDDLQNAGAELIYDPEFVALRRPRPSLASFCRMLFTYGRGRAEQFRLHPTRGSALNFVPPLFVLYLVVLPLLSAPTVLARLAAHANPWAIWLMVNAPLALYLAALLGQAAVSARAHGPARAAAALPLVVASHLFYGLGCWRGLFTRLRRRGPPSAGVAVERMEVPEPRSDASAMPGGPP
ncbi:MAG: glycosyltransferase [Verrucomicrobia bacterium]|nr:glycosyltransferase [Verrucomicrobiota bacterium]